MPVDPDGKLIFRNPASRHATPINRKPKKHKRLLKRLLIGSIGLIVFILLVNFCIGFYKGFAQSFNWSTIKTYTGQSYGHTPAFEVPIDWQLAWSCTPSRTSSDSPADAAAISIYVDYASGSETHAVNAQCQGNTPGIVEMHQAGTITISMVTEGQWMVSIEIPQ